jgi:uncharacterized protein
VSDVTEKKQPTRIEPPESEDAKPFWDASREGRFVLQWCIDCNKTVFYPRAICPTCFGENLEWREASGTGVVHATSTVHVQANPFQQPPYNVSIVETDEGARMMSNVVGIDSHDVTVGMKVQLKWEPLTDGRNLPTWEPLA